MRKNGAKYITIRQYRLFDLIIFAFLAVVAELICYYSQIWFPKAAIYTLNLMLPIITLIIVRWGWYGIAVAAAEGALYCLLRGTSWQFYIIYIIGNSAIAAELLLVKIIGNERLQKHWYFALLVVVCGWVSVNFIRSSIYAIIYGNFGGVLGTMFGMSDGGLLALFMGALIILVCRMRDGLFENQKLYLERFKKEREEKLRETDDFEGALQISQEDLDIIKKDYNDF